MKSLLKKMIENGKFITHLKIILLFSILYWIANQIETKYNMKVLDDSGNTTDKPVKPVTFFNAFYFSLVTQTTVGYGKTTPSTKITQVINIMQLLSIFGVYLF